MIRFDRTQISVVAVCACGWRTVTRSMIAADRAAMDHVNIAHPAPDDLAVQRFLAASRQRAHRRDTLET